MKLLRLYLAGAVLASFLPVHYAVAAAHLSGLPASTSYSAGPEVCLGCHTQESVKQVQNSAHGQTRDARSPFAQKGCESCHGPAGEHAGDPSGFRPVVIFGAGSAAADQNKMCLGCHEGQNRAQWNWHVSAHARADVTCASCHDPHNPNQKVLSRDTQPQVCMTCHTDKRLALMQFSRHPMREGQVVCADCHNPHGGVGPSMLARATVNETCYQCHAEKRGPFLFEHEPVQDNCVNCHNPHGTNNDNMLVLRPPMLCQTCHIWSRHPGTNYVNREVVGGGNSRTIGKGCINCHAQIHGTNHPAGVTLRR